MKKARTGLKLSLESVAAQSGLSEQDLKGVEVYTKHPAESEVRRLGGVLGLRPDQLWDLAQETWSAPDVPWQIGTEYTVDCLTNHYPEHCYVVTAASGECLVVDPGDEAERIVQTATRDGRRPVAILITHRHRDHTGAVVPVQGATGAPVYVQSSDREGVAGVPGAAVRLLEGDVEVTAGPFRLRVVHTPGHTPGGATFVLQSATATAAFCGDTLFAGSAGSAGHSYTELLHSLRQKLAQLPPPTVFYPGHGPATTLANEIARNPFL